MLVILVGSPWRARLESSSWVTRPVGHNLKEASGAGSALVVHQVAHNLPVGKDDHLRALPSDINYGAFLAEEEGGAGPMAGDLGHGLVSIGHGDPSIAGLDDLHLIRGRIDARCS
jgi:hypothetical protein